MVSSPRVHYMAIEIPEWMMEMRCLIRFREVDICTVYTYENVLYLLKIDRCTRPNYFIDACFYTESIFKFSGQQNRSRN